jgi:hypothetical protein
MTELLVLCTCGHDFGTHDGRKACGACDCKKFQADATPAPLPKGISRDLIVGTLAHLLANVGEPVTVDLDDEETVVLSPAHLRAISERHIANWAHELARKSVAGELTPKAPKRKRGRR